MQPLISVIVPVYNGREYLTNCIESIEAQTYPNLEILLIDDGSTDGTDQICQRLAETYPNIRLKTLGDEGVSTARNTGLDMAGGEYVTFVDADDRLMPETLENLYRCIQETGSDVAGCGFAVFHTQSEWEQLCAGGGDRQPVYKDYDREAFIREALLKGNSRCWSKLYRTSAAGEVRFRRDLTIGEDMLFLVDLLPYVKKITETDYKGYGYFQNPRGAMMREFKPSYMDQITCWEIARERIGETDRALYGKVTTILIMAILLTAGKLAWLNGKERKKQRQYVEICHAKLAEEIKNREAVAGLSGGYRIKTAIFAGCPQLYLWLYHFKKYISH